MALAFNNNNHIIYYHMDAQQSTGLVQTYFTGPDYLVVQDRIYAAFLSPDTFNLTEPFIRVSHWNKSSEFTLLTFTTFVPRPKKVKNLFKNFQTLS